MSFSAPCMAPLPGKNISLIIQNDGDLFETFLNNFLKQKPESFLFSLLAVKIPVNVWFENLVSHQRAEVKCELSTGCEIMLCNVDEWSMLVNNRLTMRWICKKNETVFLVSSHLKSQRDIPRFLGPQRVFKAPGAQLLHNLGGYFQNLREFPRDSLKHRVLSAALRARWPQVSEIWREMFLLLVGCKSLIYFIQNINKQCCKQDI